MYYKANLTYLREFLRTKKKASEIPTINPRPTSKITVAKNVINQTL
jgi:hypothetical protein